MAGRHRGPGKSESKIEGLQPPFVRTSGNILTPVQAFQNGITGTPPSPTARGYNKGPGEETFPSAGSARKSSNPMSAFGLGGDK